MENKKNTLDENINKNNGNTEEVDNCCDKSADDQEMVKENPSEECSKDCEANNNSEERNNLVEQLSSQLEDKSRKCEEYYNLLQRTAAEFDNFRKRTAREKESIYYDAVCEVVGAFLPVVDNLERAIDACNKGGDVQSLKDGISLVIKQINDVMNNIGIEEIKSVGQPFDPQLHNAVMHVEDEKYGHNEVIEEFQKGYKIKDKVIRYCVVKVAN